MAEGSIEGQQQFIAPGGDLLQGAANNLYIDSLEPLLRTLEGPVKSFTLEKATTASLLEVALQNDYIPEGAFAGKDVFLSDEAAGRKQHLKAVKTLAELFYYVKIDEARDTQNADPLLHVMGLDARRQLWLGVIVESARRLNTETPDQLAKNGQLYEDCLDMAQKELYSEPNKDVAFSVVAQYRGLAERNFERIQQNPELQKLKDELDNEYPWLNDQDAKFAEIELSNERKAEFKQEFESRYRPSLQAVHDEFGELRQDNLVSAVNSYLTQRGLQKTSQDTQIIEGWTCVPNPNRRGFFVNLITSQLECGLRDRAPTWDEFDALMMHEVEVHIVRAQNARDKNLPFLASGLPGSSDAEEGIGVMFANLMRGTNSEDLEGEHYRYIGIAFAEGIMDNRPHNETETYRLLRKFIKFTSSLETSSSKEAAIESDDQPAKDAFDTVKRIFRGMPPGKKLWKDGGYLPGKQMIQRMIAESKSSAAEIIDYIQQGKFDPSNPDDRGVLKIAGLKDTI